MTENEEPQLPALISQPATIVEAIQTTVPQLQKMHKGALAAMEKELVKPTNDEEFEAKNKFLSKVKYNYDLMYEKRKAITDKLEEVKDYLMQFERPLNYDGKAKSLYNDIKALQTSYQQDKLDEKKRQEAEAAKRKAIEDHKVDVQTSIRTNLSNMIMEKVRLASDWCSGYFKDATLANFDDMEKKFNGYKPRLKEEDYNKCFTVSYNKGLLDDSTFAVLVEQAKTEGPYQKWNAAVVAHVIPILNEWRAKTTDIKQEIQLRESAASEEERKKIQEAQDKKKAEDEKKRQDDLKRIEEEQKQAIANKEAMDKLSNSFQEQATVQQLDDAGPVKKVMKLEDPTQPMPLTHIIYAVFAAEKFDGILKKDKDKKIVMDAQGRPEYIPAVQWWIDQYLRIADHKKFKIEHTVIFEDSKVIVRK